MAFIPLHDGNPLRHIRRPYVAWSLILANVVIFIFIQGGLGEVNEATAISFGLIPAVFNDIVDLPSRFTSVPDALTLFTYAFLHGDIWHLGGNMLFLWVFGDNVEDALGHVRFLIFYCLCAVGAGYVYVLSAPSSEAPVIGASGAIAGCIAAYFMLHPYAKIWILAFGRIPLRLNALLVLGFWILFQLYGAFAVGGEGGIAWWSHIGGLVVGAALVLFLRRPGVRLFSRPDPGSASGAGPGSASRARPGSASGESPGPKSGAGPWSA